VNPDLINKMETLLEDIQGTRVEEFIVWIDFQDLTLNNARIVIRLDIKLMNVHLLNFNYTQRTNLKR
jgi:hypothetical protein